MKPAQSGLSGSLFEMRETLAHVYYTNPVVFRLYPCREVMKLYKQLVQKQTQQKQGEYYTTDSDGNRVLHRPMTGGLI